MRVVVTPSRACSPLSSWCAAITPIEPTSPLGVTLTSPAADASQYAADAAWLLATATMGFRRFAAAISAASSSTPNTEPPGLSTSSTIPPTSGSAIASRSPRVSPSVLVPPLDSVMRSARWLMTP
jgi:hypothetical protein